MALAEWPTQRNLRAAIDGVALVIAAELSTPFFPQIAVPKASEAIFAKMV
jgi:hypothetical protein